MFVVLAYSDSSLLLCAAARAASSNRDLWQVLTGHSALRDHVSHSPYSLLVADSRCLSLSLSPVSLSPGSD